MSVVVEEEYEFHLPDDCWFRFESCPTYSELSGHNLKEMDFSWIVVEDETPKQLWLLEAKYVRGEGVRMLADDDNGVGSGLKQFIADLSRKISDALFMVMSVWCKTNTGERLLGDIQQSCPSFPAESIPIFPVIALRIGCSSRAPLYDMVRTKVEHQIKGRLNLLDVPRVVLIILDESPHQFHLPINPVEN